RRHMRFEPWPGVPRSRSPAINAARCFDLVLVPLVGFDDDGNRLGMGAGFYDRHFAFLRHRQAWRRPLLLGLAFEIQRLERLAVKPHDVALWGIVTECAVYGRAGAHIRGSHAESDP
ncbi:MAG: 5-formyltetrahydrofolate cyclo-ligase, partial [Steroidobacteraceae bacterium]